MIVRDLPDLHVAVPPDAHTLDGFRKWACSATFPKTGLVSLIQGEVLIDMSPERVDSHNQVKCEVNNVIGPLVKNLKLGRYYPDQALLANDQAGLANEPDAAFASWATLRRRRLVRTVRRDDGVDAAELNGTPDWVLEIVSSSSVRKDRQLLFEAYFQAGIPEYWVIDARFDSLEFTIFVRGETRYEAVAAQDGWLTSPVFNRQFRLTRTLDEIGDWLYDLQIREVP